MATHSSILAWKIAWPEEAGGLQSMGLQRVRHNWAHLLLLLSRFSHVRLCVTHRRQPTRLPRPWVSPGKNTGVGCHFLIQRMKVKSESEVTQLCPTLRIPMDCSLPGSSMGFEKLNNQGLNPRPWQWKCQVLTIELSGNFPFSFLLKLFLYFLKLCNVERENYKLERMIAAQWVV